MYYFHYEPISFCCISLYCVSFTAWAHKPPAVIVSVPAWSMVSVDITCGGNYSRVEGVEKMHHLGDILAMFEGNESPIQSTTLHSYTSSSYTHVRKLGRVVDCP